MEKFLKEDRYRIVEKIHEGSQGYVYKAEDIKLRKIVAVKEMVSEYPSDEEKAAAGKRFREEAKILFTLEYSGIPKVTDFFEDNEKLYIVMDFIEGEDLETYVKKRENKPLPEDLVLNWAEQILEITHYLHSLDPPLVYRDMKPSNLMVDANGKISLVDFGIARIFDPESKGTIAGTPGFAAPEQYKGFSEPRSDLYSVGATLHCLLTGINPENPDHPPFQFDKISKFNENISAKTEKLVAWLLEFDINKRPESASHVLEVMKSNLAVPESKKLVMEEEPIEIEEKADDKKGKLPFLIPLILLLALFLGTAVYLKNIKRNKNVKSKKEIGLNSNNYSGRNENELPDSPVVNGMTASDAEVVSLSGPTVKTLKQEYKEKPENHLTSLCFSPDGQKVLAGYHDGSIIIRDINNGKIVGNLKGHLMAIIYIEYSKDGKYIITTSRDKTNRIWDSKTCKEISKVESSSYSNQAHLSKDNKYFYTCGNGIYIWSFNGKLLNRMHGSSIDISSDGKLLGIIHHKFDFSADRRKVTKITSGASVISSDNLEWEKVNYTDISRWKISDFAVRENNSIEFIKFSPDCKTVVLAEENSTVSFWTTNGKHIKTLPAYPETMGIKKSFPAKYRPGSINNYSMMQKIKYSPDGKLLAGTTYIGGMIIWNVENNKIVFKYSTYNSGEMVDISFSPNGKYFAISKGAEYKLYKIKH